MAWDGAWLRESNSFDLTYGSISSKQFLIRNRLKISKRLTDRLSFHFHWFEDRDFEQDRRALPIELKYAVSDHLAVSAFGSTSLYKAENDIGASLFWTPTADWEVRASGVWGDFQRKVRTLKTDSWQEQAQGWTLSATRLPPTVPDFQYAEIHYEPRSRRADRGLPVRDLAYRSLFFEGLSGPWGWRILYEDALDCDYGNDASAGTGTNSVTQRRRALHQFEYSLHIGDGHSLTPGLNAFYREVRGDDELRIYRELLPTLWLHTPMRDKAWGRVRWDYGYDATIYELRHTRQQGHETTDRDLHHRLNVKPVMQFKQGGELSLLFTIDLDRPGAEPWEGGAAQFRTEF
ncbi:MAG: hypothetical protein HC902_11880 [Calothrix sp. SM1_5_4]|nr:hypothetical protein [Calothrix sp. SM1_5_4]